MWAVYPQNEAERDASMRWADDNDYDPISLIRLRRTAMMRDLGADSDGSPESRELDRLRSLWAAEGQTQRVSKRNGSPARHERYGIPVVNREQG